MPHHSSSITILGRIPSKKNSRCIFVRGGKLFNIPSKKYSEWHKEASALLLKDKNTPRSIYKIRKIVLRLWAPDKRAGDLTNKAESIMDLLVDNKVIEDDNWFIVGNIHIKFEGVDRINPRCEVTIFYG